MRKSVLIVVALVAVVALTGATGCRRVPLSETPSGRQLAVSTETTQVALGDATALRTRLRIGVGQLSLAAGEPSSTTALDATFKYAPASWKPDVVYSVNGTQGVLSVEQPPGSDAPNLGRARNEWNLKLAQGVPTDLSLKLGVGESTVDLRGVDLTALEAITGVGEAKIDLSGPLTHDLTARVEAGIGAVTVTVPSNTGVRIVGGQDGLGDLNADGFSQDGSDLVNDAWSKPGPKLTLYITRGIGDVKVVSAD